MRSKIATLFLVLVLFLQGCTPQKDTYTKISDYGLWKDSTRKIISDHFEQSLPDAQIVYDYGKTYYYKSAQALLGDVNFVIYVVLQFNDITSYESELNKYATLFSDGALKMNNTTYYIIQGSLEKTLEFLDDKTYDGMFYNFEIISTNIDDYSISFINARVWDYYTDEVLVEYLQQVYKKTD